jgi:hypothetical protein
MDNIRKSIIVITNIYIYIEIYKNLCFFLENIKNNFFFFFF